MSRARTWQSNIAGPRIKSTGCRRWRPNWVHQQVAVIATTGSRAPALAAKAATTTISIVFNVSEDPVRRGLVASLARPGGNVTGVNFFSGKLAAKWLELLRELVPGTARVAVLVNPSSASNTETTLRDMEVAGRAIRVGDAERTRRTGDVRSPAKRGAAAV